MIMLFSKMFINHSSKRTLKNGICFIFNQSLQMYLSIYMIIRMLNSKKRFSFVICDRFSENAYINVIYEYFANEHKHIQKTTVLGRYCKFSVLVLTYFRLMKHSYVFCPETTFASPLHMMVLFLKWLLSHTLSRLFMVLLVALQM